MSPARLYIVLKIKQLPQLRLKVRRVVPILIHRFISFTNERFFTVYPQKEEVTDIAKVGLNIRICKFMQRKNFFTDKKSEESEYHSGCTQILRYRSG